VKDEVSTYRIIISPPEPDVMVLGFMMKVARIDLTTIVLNEMPERWRFVPVANTTDAYTLVALFSFNRRPTDCTLRVHAYNEIPGVQTLLSKGDNNGVTFL